MSDKDIRKIPTHMLLCRDVGHHWDFYIPLEPRRTEYGTPRMLRCDHGCGTMRVEIINALGVVDTRQYEYTDAYHEACAFTRAQARAEVTRRLSKGLIETKKGEQ